VTYTRCRIDTINCPDDGHMVARNMWRIEINIHERELCVRLVIYKDYIEMHGRQKKIRMLSEVCKHFSLHAKHVNLAIKTIFVPHNVTQITSNINWNKNMFCAEKYYLEII
jgi:hypothetical protein